jgi:hypothetical protein
MVKLELTDDEARKILHCLVRTNSRNSSGNLEGILDICEKVEKDINKQLTDNGYYKSPAYLDTKE